MPPSAASPEQSVTLESCIRRFAARVLDDPGIHPLLADAAIGAAGEALFELGELHALGVVPTMPDYWSVCVQLSGAVYSSSSSGTMR